jgi:adiponectin receptor
MAPKLSYDEKDSSPVTKAEKTAKQALTILWDDIPEWMRDNHYITTGYRPQSNSYWKSASSITYLHNESVNIWTHIVGAALAAITAVLMYNVLRPRFEMATREDVMVFSCFFLGAVACLGMSATYHTLLNHSDMVARFGQRLDHVGIVVLIWGSFVPSIYYGFSAEPGLVRLYWTMVRLLSSIACLLLILNRSRQLELQRWS